MMALSILSVSRLMVSVCELPVSLRVRVTPCRASSTVLLWLVTAMPLMVSSAFCAATVSVMLPEPSA
ncbi:hypothetical protein D3C76_1852890 [compost metagenome]